MKRTFVHTGGAWYGKAALKGRRYVDDVIIQICDDDGNMQHEMVVEFHDLKMTTGLSARVCCFDADTSVLLACTDVLEALRESKAWSPNNFTKLLIRLGFEDLTPLFADKNGAAKMEMAKERLVPMVTKLANEIDWQQIPGDFVPIGLFVKRGEFFVAPICIGAPDVDEDLLIGASIYGTSSIAMSDEEQDHYETADMLLAKPDQFFAAVAPNQTATT